MLLVYDQNQFNYCTAIVNDGIKGKINTKISGKMRIFAVYIQQKKNKYLNSSECVHSNI